MTQSQTTTTTATFSNSIHIYNSELIPMLVGLTVKSATAVNNLAYINKDKQEVAKCGLLIEFSDGTKVGLFRWDLLPALVEFEKDAPKALVLTDTLHTTAKDTLRTAQNEQSWLDGIGSAIVGKTAGIRNYIGKRSNGGVFSGVVLTID
jgi:hypothetical protein